MPLNVKCKNCNNYRNSWCERVIDSPDPDMVRDCRHFWEKTNADRIRAMSDEELATQLVQVFKEGIKVLTDMDMPEELLDKFWNSFLERLKQPAE